MGVRWLVDRRCGPRSPVTAKADDVRTKELTGFSRPPAHGILRRPVGTDHYVYGLACRRVSARQASAIRVSDRRRPIRSCSSSDSPGDSCGRPDHCHTPPVRSSRPASSSPSTSWRRYRTLPRVIAHSARAALLTTGPPRASSSSAAAVAGRSRPRTAPPMTRSSSARPTSGHNLPRTAGDRSAQRDSSDRRHCDCRRTGPTYDQAGEEGPHRCEVFSPSDGRESTGQLADVHERDRHDVPGKLTGEVVRRTSSEHRGDSVSRTTRRTSLRHAERRRGRQGTPRTPRPTRRDHQLRQARRRTRSAAHPAGAPAPRSARSRPPASHRIVRTLRSHDHLRPARPPSCRSAQTASGNCRRCRELGLPGRNERTRAHGEVADHPAGIRRHGARFRVG